MKIKIAYKLFLTAIIVMVIASCKTSSRQPVNLQLGDDEFPMDFNSRGKTTQITFHEAVKARMLGEYEKAEKLFLKVLDTDKKNATSMYELARLNVRANDMEKASFYAGNAVKLEPDNQWFKELYAQTLSALGKDKEAMALFNELIDSYPKVQSYYFELAYLYEKEKDYKKAIQTYDKLQKLIGLDEQVVEQKKNLYIQLNDLDGAATEIKQLIEAYPQEASYYGMLAELYQVNGQSTKAIETLEQYHEKYPEDVQGKFILGIFYKENGFDSKAGPLLEDAFASPEIDIDRKIAFLMGFMNKLAIPMYKIEALKLAQLTISAHPNEAKGHAISGDFYLNSNEPEKALKQYKKALRIKEDNFAIWQQALSIEAGLNRFDSLLVYSEKAIELFPSQPMPYYFNGIANMQLKQYNEAISMFNQTLIIASTNLQLKADVYSALGDAYHELGMHEKSDESYEESLKLNPDNFMVLNNYSYYLSLRKSRLEKAKEMAEKANELYPGNSSFQDTYGWILYELGQYESAKAWLEKAMENGGDKNGVILEHFGDVLYKLNDIDNAVKYWEKAKTNGNNNPQLDKKISDRKIYE
jgi:tetratricopeptide (TPR) repeat protein